MKITDTVERLTENPQIRARYVNVVLACANELCDHFSLRVIQANRRMAEVDPDNEHEWFQAADERDEAEKAFMVAHADTEMQL